MIPRSWVVKIAKTMRSPAAAAMPMMIAFRRRSAGSPAGPCDDDGIVAGKHEVDDDDGRERVSSETKTGSMISSGTLFL